MVEILEKKYYFIQFTQVDVWLHVYISVCAMVAVVLESSIPRDRVARFSS